jgi:tRNA pseudouridine synthase 10
VIRTFFLIICSKLRPFLGFQFFSSWQISNHMSTPEMATSPVLVVSVHNLISSRVCKLCIRRLLCLTREQIRGFDIPDPSPEPCAACSGIAAIVPNLIETARSAISRSYFHDFQLTIPSALLKTDNRLLREFHCDPSCSLKNDIKAQLLIALRRSQDGPLLHVAVHNSQSYNCELRLPPLYLTGRYLKMSRRVSHSRFMQGHPLGSVEGLLIEAANTAKIVKCTDVRFQSAGREDINVRMIGTGRPFFLTFVNPMPCADQPAPKSSADFAASIGERLPAQLECKHGVYGTQLAVTTTQPVYQVKKTKCYRCVVYCSAPVTAVMLQRLDSVSNLTIQQQTPARVTHRREMMVRQKLLFTITYTPLTDHFFILDLETSGGTYIKEFVHSDFGRTQPSLGDLISPGIPIDCQLMQLDVVSIAE